MDQDFNYNLLRRLYERIDQLEKRVEFFEDNNPPISFTSRENTNFSNVDDEIYEEAKKLVIEIGQASASILQRYLRIGYARAARLLDMLEENGIIGPADGASPRDVLI